MSDKKSLALNTRSSNRISTGNSGNSPRLRPAQPKPSPSPQPGTRLTSYTPKLKMSASPGAATQGTSLIEKRQVDEAGAGYQQKQVPQQIRKKRMRTSPARADAMYTRPAGSPLVTGKGQKMRTRLSTGSIHMNGTTTISTAKEKAELDMIIKQIAKSDTTPPAKALPSSSKKRSSGSIASSPTEEGGGDHPPPKKRKIGRNDGSGEDNRNDYFCWMCHKEGMLVCCELCPRVYHTKCLGLTGELPQDWVCPECEKIMRAECIDTRSKAMEMLTVEQLCILLKYALDRMKHQGSDPFLKAVDPKLVPSYSDYVFNPMDLTMMEKNIKKKQYGCTEAFLSDAKWILHNCTVYNGAHSSLTNSAKMIIKICKHETAEIELCPDCYLNSCIRKNDEWFSEPCRVPHTLVWAKLKGYPFWPAKALREAEGQVDVRFFGAHDRSWVPVSQCFLLSKNIPTSLQKGKKNHGLSGAINELHVHINKLRELFGGFEYAPFRTPYDKTDSYKPINMKSPTSNTSSFYSTKSRHGQMIKRSSAAKTASALKSKYNMMANVKKLDGTPKKGKRDPSKTDDKDMNVDKRTDNDVDGDIIEEDLVKDKGSSALQETITADSDNVKDYAKACDIDENSEKHVETKSVLRTSAETDNSSEKAPNASTSIVDRLAQKIKAINEERLSENESESSENVKKTDNQEHVIEKISEKEVIVNNNDVASEEIVNHKDVKDNVKEISDEKEDIFKDKSNETETITANVEEKQETNKQCSETGYKNVNSESKETTNRSEKPVDTSKTEFSENIQVKQSSDDIEDKDKEQTKDNAKSEENKGKVDSKQISDCSSTRIHQFKVDEINTSEDDKDIKSKETYKKNLESTILSCKAKLGLETESVSDGSVHEEDADESEGDSEDEESSDDSDTEDAMEYEEVGIGDDIEKSDWEEEGKGEAAGEEDTDESAVEEDTEDPAEEKNKEEVVEKGAGGPVEKNTGEKLKPDTAEPIEESSKNGTRDLVEQGSGDTVKTNVTQDTDKAGDKDAKNFSEKDKLSKDESTSKDKDPIESKAIESMDIVSELSGKSETQDQKDLNESKQITLKEDSINSKEITNNSQVNKSNESKSVEDSDKESSTSEMSQVDKNVPEKLDGKTIDKKSPKNNQKSDTPNQISSENKSKDCADDVDKSSTLENKDDSDKNKLKKSKESANAGVAIKDQTIKASLNQINVYRNPRYLENKPKETGFCANLLNGIKSPVKPLVRKDLTDTDTVEEDSDTDRLVIDLDSDKEASPKISKFQVRGGEVKSGVEFKKYPSPLAVEKKASPEAEDKRKLIKEKNATLQKNKGKSVFADVIKNVSSKANSLSQSDEQEGDKEDMEVDDVDDTLDSEEPVLIGTESEEKTTENHPIKLTTKDTRIGALHKSSPEPRVPSLSASPANKVAEKFSKKLMSAIQGTLDEMYAEVLEEKTKQPVQGDLQQQLDHARWKYNTELTELKHNFKLTISEMKSLWEAEKKQLKKALIAKHELDIAETKKKQWCAQCGKEAIFYCCWNTSYCDYPCQQSHWPQHMLTCLQTNKDKASTVKATTATTPAVTVTTSLVTPAVVTITGSINTISTPSTSTHTSSHNSAVNFSTQDGIHTIKNSRQMLQDQLTAAMYREEEKRGEMRAGVSPKYIPMSSPINQIHNPHQSSTAGIGSSLLFPSNLTSTNQIVHPPQQPAMMQQIPRNMFINQQIPLQSQPLNIPPSRSVGNRMLLGQPVMQQQAMYPIQLPPGAAQNQQQANGLGGTILFQNPQQQGIMGYGMRPPF